MLIKNFNNFLKSIDWMRMQCILKINKDNYFPVKTYQNVCRIYLDEYNVEEWDYLLLFDNRVIMKRFTEIR
jgi:hypothetical protein